METFFKVNVFSVVQELFLNLEDAQENVGQINFMFDKLALVCLGSKEEELAV